MINIADNPIVRGQVKKASEGEAKGNADASSVQQREPPAYPAKSLVLEGGRYYAGKTEK